MADGVDKFQVRQPREAVLAPVDRFPLAVPPTPRVCRRIPPNLNSLRQLHPQHQDLKA